MTGSGLGCGSKLASAVVDEVLDVRLERRLRRVVPGVGCVLTLCSAPSKPERRRSAQGNARLRIGHVHRPMPTSAGKHLRRQATHQRFEIALVAGVKFELIIERQAQRRGGRTRPGGIGTS